jgi:hypothetical protein
MAKAAVPGNDYAFQIRHTSQLSSNCKTNVMASSAWSQARKKSREP